MSPSLDSIEHDIARKRRELNEWLAAAYSGEVERQYCGEMDAGYPHWIDIQTLAGSVFDLGLAQRIGKSSIDSLLFFISRSDEIGVIIAWLSPIVGTPLSGCGNLSYPDFVYLCEQALIRNDDYCDYQLAACFRKRDFLDDRAISVVHRFFNKNDSYTRRMALHTFEHFSLPQAVELAQELWHTVDCEFAKLSCLHALKRFPDAKLLFDRYLQDYRNTYDVDAEDYRRSHMLQLTSGNDT